MNDTDSTDSTEFEDLLKQARALPNSIEPPAELWADVRAQTIDAPVRRLWLPREVRAPLAAAAVVLIVSVSALTWWVARNTQQPRVVFRPVAMSANLVAMKQAEADNIAVTRTLLQVFEQRRSQMDPKVVLTVEQNLRIMDQAIDAAKKALASDPANQDVAGILTNTYQSKVKMLRRAVRPSGGI
jgi:hypothetical protein